MTHYPFYLSAALGVFALLTAEAPAAREGALWGLDLCLHLLIPALLPFFGAAGLLNRLGLPGLLARRLRKPLALLGLSGPGAAAFLLGLTGGYPLGAATVADFCRKGQLERREAERLLGFCDNTGPSFAVGVMGAAVFGRAWIGLLLYAVHLLTAAAMALLSARRARPVPAVPEDEGPPAVGEALAAAALSAGRALASVCVFVVFFSALLYALDANGLFSLLAGAVSGRLGTELRWSRALLWSLLELSGAAGLLSGLAPTPVNLALASFALGWGGLCVHLQSLGVTAGTGLSLRRRLTGKLVHGLVSAVLIYIMSTVLCKLKIL